MAISNIIEKLGKAIFETPFGTHRIAKDAPELAEIRLALLEAVKAKSHRASGQQVFAYNLARLRLRGIPEDQADVMSSDFLADYFAQELKSSLKRSNYRFPADLKVDIVTTPDLPAEGEDWLSVETELKKTAEAPAGSAAPATLRVVNGVANVSELVLVKPRVNIGRTEEVFRTAGPSRRNDLAFSEDNEINRSVSREHGHVLYSQRTGLYRIFNDRSYKGEENCGIWIVRDSLSQPVHRSARGTVLKPGDEIHLGKAILAFEPE